MTSLLRRPLVRRAAAVIAAKEIIERIQEARQPKRSFLRRHGGKLALLAVAGAGFYVYQQQRARLGAEQVFSSQGPVRREPAVEPDERLDAPLLAPEEATQAAKEPASTPSS